MMDGGEVALKLNIMWKIHACVVLGCADHGLLVDWCDLVREVLMEKHKSDLRA